MDPTTPSQRPKTVFFRATQRTSFALLHLPQLRHVSWWLGHDHLTNQQAVGLLIDLKGRPPLKVALAAICVFSPHQME